VFSLTLGFFVTRVFVGIADQRVWVAHSGTFAAVVGVLLALFAAARFTWEASALHRRWLSFALRVIGLAPVVAMSLVAMFSTTVPRSLQSMAIVSLALTVVLVGVRAVAHALRHARWLAAATMGLFVVGELIELFGPVAMFTSRQGSSLPRLATSLGHVSEVCTFAGVALALMWSVRSTASRIGIARAAAFLAMPLGFAAVLATLPLRFPRTTESVARAAFGARFDLANIGGAGHPSRLVLGLYALLFAGLVAASSMSLATQSADRGGGARRALAWVCVLLAAFGSVSIAGPIDPLRAVNLMLGLLLLEQAVERD
jgi:hypothetical protein